METGADGQGVVVTGGCVVTGVPLPGIVTGGVTGGLVVTGGGGVVTGAGVVGWVVVPLAGSVVPAGSGCFGTVSQPATRSAIASAPVFRILGMLFFGVR